MQLKRDVANLIQEQRSLICQFKPTDLLRDCTREGAALVAKEVAFEQAAGDRSTVDLYKCSAFSSAALMNGPRDRARKTPQVLPPRRRARPGAVWISSFCRSGMRLNAIDRISTGPVARKANQTYGH